MAIRRMARLRFVSIRAVPKLAVYNHPVYPVGKEDIEVKKLPTAPVGVRYRASAPTLEKVEQKAEAVEKADTEKESEESKKEEVVVKSK